MNVDTSDGTATAGDDYTAVNRRVYIEVNYLSVSVSVPISDDSISELDETFTLTLSNPSRATLPNSPEAQATIRDNDSPQFLGSVTNLTAACVDGEVTITWGPPAGGSVNDYRYSIYGHPEMVGGIYGDKIASGTTIATKVTVSVTGTTLTYYAEVQARAGDNSDQAGWLPTGVFICTASPPVVSLPGAPLAVTEGSTVQVTATLDKAATGSAAVQFSTSGAIGGTGACFNGADFSVDSTSFVFDNTTTATISFTACDDTDTDDETVTLMLTTTGISGLQLGSPTTVVVTITDDDTSSAPLLK